jgi:hypothetical protein
VITKERKTASLIPFTVMLKYAKSRRGPKKKVQGGTPTVNILPQEDP